VGTKINKEVLVIRTIVRLITPMICTFALYIQFNGEAGPGGGFQSGIVMSIAFIMHNLIDLCSGVKIKDLIKTETLKIVCVAGIMIYIVAGSFFSARIFDYGCLGKDSSSIQAKRRNGLTCIEVGVGLAVFGSMSLIYRTLRDQVLKYHYKDVSN